MRTFDYMTEVLSCLVAKNEVPYYRACALASDLEWYINSGRASADWIKHLLAKRPFMIARRLAKGGSAREIIDRITEYIYQ